MRIAVTGASGFIGRYVLAELDRQNVEVIAVARHVPERTVTDARWVSLDISNPPSEVFRIIGEPDVLLHLAWSGLPNYGSLHHIETELPGHYMFLSSLIRQGLQALVAVGTCFEYGFQSGALSAEQHTQPQNPYALAKDTLRKQLEYLRGETPFTFTWPRLFYLYGKGQSATSLFAQLCSAVEEGQPSFAMSGGEQLRDYLPVESVANRLAEFSLARSDLGVVNVCSGVPISVRRLVERWISENNWSIDLDLGRVPYSTYEPMAFWGVGENQPQDCMPSSHRGSP